MRDFKMTNKRELLANWLEDSNTDQTSAMKVHECLMALAKKTIVHIVESANSYKTILKSMTDKDINESYDLAVSLGLGKVNESKGDVEVVYTNRDYKEVKKLFQNDPQGAPENAMTKARAYAKKLEDKDAKGDGDIRGKVIVREINESIKPVNESFGDFNSLEDFKDEAKNRGFKVSPSVDPDTGESGHYFVAKDKEGNTKGSFCTDKSKGKINESLSSKFLRRTSSLKINENSLGTNYSVLLVNPTSISDGETQRRLNIIRTVSPSATIAPGIENGFMVAPNDIDSCKRILETNGLGCQGQSKITES